MGNIALQTSAKYCKFDAAIMIGRHAMAGHTTGVMAHSYSSVAITSMTLNGNLIGEIGIEALQLASLNIPVIMIAGDEAACAEGLTLLNKVAIAPVKQGFAQHAAISMHSQDACQLIYEQTSKALSNLQHYTIIQPPAHYCLEVSCIDKRSAKARAKRKNAVFLPPNKYRIETNDPWQLG